jgi:OOP family OmpA-OmpF porin
MQSGARRQRSGGIRGVTRPGGNAYGSGLVTGTKQEVSVRVRPFELGLGAGLALLVALAGPGHAQTPPAAPALPTIENNMLVIEAPVLFETGSDTLEAGDQPALQAMKAFLDAKSYVTTLRIESHTDADGDDAANQALSNKRALSAARWLVAQGVDCKRLLPVGFGENKPVAANDTPENKAKNRRTVAFVAALRERAIGGMPLDGGGLVAGDPCAK